MGGGRANDKESSLFSWRGGTDRYEGAGIRVFLALPPTTSNTLPENVNFQIRLGGSVTRTLP